MFALTPQTITMPEGLTPLASNTDPAGETAAGTAFAQVMGGLPQPAALPAGQTSGPTSATLADAVWTAPLLAWPTQPTNTPPLTAPDLTQNPDVTQNTDITVDAPALAGADNPGTESVELPLGTMNEAVSVELVNLPYLDPLQGLPKVSDRPQSQSDATDAARWMVGEETVAQPPAAPQPVPNPSAGIVAGHVMPQTPPFAAPGTAETATAERQGRAAPAVPPAARNDSAKTPLRGQGLAKSARGVVTNPADVPQHSVVLAGDGKTAHVSQTVETPKPTNERVARTLTASSTDAPLGPPLSDEMKAQAVRGPVATEAAAFGDPARSVPTATGAQASAGAVARSSWPTGPAAIPAPHPTHPDLSTSATTTSATQIQPDRSLIAAHPNRDSLMGLAGIKTQGIEAPVEDAGTTEQMAFDVKRPAVQPEGGQPPQSPRWAGPAQTPKIGDLVPTPSSPQPTWPAPVDIAGTKAQTSDGDFRPAKVLQAGTTEKGYVPGSSVPGGSKISKVPSVQAPQAEPKPDLIAPAFPRQTDKPTATQALPAQIRPATNSTAQAPSVQAASVQAASVQAASVQAASVQAASVQGPSVQGPLAEGPLAEGQLTTAPARREQTVRTKGPELTVKPAALKTPVRAQTRLDGSAKVQVRQDEPPQVPINPAETPRSPTPGKLSQWDKLALNPRAERQAATQRLAPDPATALQTNRREMVARPPEHRIWPDNRGPEPGGFAAIDPASRPKDARSAVKHPTQTQGDAQPDPKTAAPQKAAPARPAAPIAKGGTERAAQTTAGTSHPPTVAVPGPDPVDQAPTAEQVVAPRGVDKATTTSAVRPVAAALVANTAGPLPTALPPVDLPAPQPGFVSFWQVPDASHGWQTALQFWTPPSPIARPLVRTNVQASANSARTAPQPVSIDLAAPLKVAQPPQGDDRSPPVPAKKLRDSATDDPAPSIPLPIAAPPPAATPSGPGMAPQSAASSDVDGALAYAPLPVTSPTTLSSPMTATPPMPKGLPESLARAAKEERTELLLDPMELGKVRFELVTTGDKVQINLSVERPETLDLLRRNVDSLHREFRDAGFDTATLNFGQWGKGQEEGRQSPVTAQFGDDPDLPDTGPAPIAKPNRNTSSQGLDLRM